MADIRVPSQVAALGADDPSPFGLGTLDKGAKASILETGGTVQAVAAHEPDEQFFVLARKANGQVFLRRLSGTFLVCPGVPASCVA